MIRVYVQQIQQALQSKLYFPALSLTLALPDMCGMVEYSNKSVAERYILWYDQYISPRLIDDEYDKDTPYMSGELVYNLRNTLLHQGSPSICFEKVKDDANILDKFALDLNPSPVDSVIMFYTFRGETVRAMTVNVINLCNYICESALE